MVWLTKWCIECGDNYSIKSIDGEPYCNKHYLQMKRHGRVFSRTIYDPNEIVVFDSYAEIVLYNKLSAEVARTTISLESIDAVKNKKWHMKANGYVYHDYRHNGKKVSVLLHRLLLDPPSGMVIDHIDGNSLNNKLCNIRVCTPSENAMNSGLFSHNTSGIKGVTFDNQSGLWVAQIMVEQRTVYLGSYENKSEARDARVEFATETFGEFAREGNVDEQ